LLLLTSSSFCPSSVFRESLGHSLFPERPFCPSHTGLPCCPGILGLRAGANSRRSLFGRRSDGALAPPGAASIGPGEVQGRHLPHPGGHDAAVPRRLSSAFPIPLLAPPGLCPGDWDTAASDPGGPASHEAGRLTSLASERNALRYSTFHSISLFNVKTQKTCSRYINVQIGRI
jgi:hypothetical protein